MPALAEISKSTLAERYNRARASIRNIREQGERVTEEVVGTALNAGTAYACGYVTKNHPTMVNLGTTEINSFLAAGAVCVGLGVTQVAGAQSKNLLEIGKGSLSAFAALKGAGHL
jgi:hypothetical protein|tara:strand:- start:3705 stop:4049 length:345 start_codon:yes stop_codon:yes gene_type:complete